MVSSLSAESPRVGNTLSDPETTKKIDGVPLDGAVGPPVRPPTDLGNAERLNDRHGDDLRYCHPQKSWYHYSGKRWVRDQIGYVNELAQETVREIYLDGDPASDAEALSGLDDFAKKQEADLKKKIRAWAIQSEAAPRIRAMIELARSLLGIPVLPEDFDRDPWLLNCPNGTVDLRDGRLRPHSRDDLLTALCPTEFDLDARAPRWEQFLREVTDGDGDLAEFVLRYFGYCLTGITREQVFPILWGPGANGKSVFLDTIKAVVGSDYASEAAPELFTLSKSKQHPTEIADLRGRRLIVASETEQNALLRVQLVKRLTGDARLKARFCFGDFFEFDRTHKSVLVTNEKPVISEDSEAIWRRIRLVPFTVIIPPERRDPHLLDRLIRDEAKGILASLVRGCLEWQRSGLGTAKAVESASAEYRARMAHDHADSIGRFVTGHCEKDPEAFTLAEDLRDRYEAAGYRAVSIKEFGQGMEALGFARDRRHGGRGYRGVCLRTQGPHAFLPHLVPNAETPREGGASCPI